MKGKKKESIFKKLNKRLIAVIVIVGGLFFAVQIIVLSGVGTKSQEIEIIRAELEEVRKENEELTAAIDREKSVERIEESVRGESYSEKRVIPIKPEGPIAQN